MSSHYRRLLAGNFAASCFLILFAACGGGGTEPNVPASISLNPPALAFTVIGQSQQLSPTVSDEQGNPLNGAVVTWSTSNAGVASVSSAGLVRAEGFGSAEITARAGDVTAVAEITVAQAPAQIQKVAGDEQVGV